MGLSTSVPPTVEPVTLQELKDQCKVDDTASDGYLGLLLVAAREAVENYTRRAIQTQTLVLTRSGFFPKDWYKKHPVFNRDFTWRNAIGYGRYLSVELPRPELQSVTTVQYWDSTTLTLLTLDSGSYYVVKDEGVGRIQLKDGYNWPTTMIRPDAVIITYVAGYGDTAAACPRALALAIKQMAADWFEHRNSIVIERGTLMQLPTHLESLLWQFRMPTFNEDP